MEEGRTFFVTLSSFVEVQDEMRQLGDSFYIDLLAKDLLWWNVEDSATRVVPHALKVPVYRTICVPWHL